MVKNELALPKLTPELIDAGWVPADEVIDDNHPDLRGLGHGTAGKWHTLIQRITPVVSYLENH